MIFNKSDNCRYCGGQKMIVWNVNDYSGAVWREWLPPAVEPANNELQTATPENVACIECGLVYDRDSLITSV